MRVHPVDHPAFAADVRTIVRRRGIAAVPFDDSQGRIGYRCRARGCRNRLQRRLIQRVRHLPLHVLLESPAAVHRAFDIAAHPRVQSISFGLMDFVSAHGGAIPADGMSGAGQFSHPLVVRAKLEIASACHAHGKAPSHWRGHRVPRYRGRRAGGPDCGCRRWDSPGCGAFIRTRSARSWRHLRRRRSDIAAGEPTSSTGRRPRTGRRSTTTVRLHDRASYRLYWHVLERALSHRPGPARVGQAAFLRTVAIMRFSPLRGSRS